MKAAGSSVDPKRPLRRTRVSVPRPTGTPPPPEVGNRPRRGYVSGGGGGMRLDGAGAEARCAQSEPRRAGGGEATDRHGRSGRKGGRAWSVLLRAALGLRLAPTRIGGPPRPSSRRLAGSESARGRCAFEHRFDTGFGIWETVFGELEGPVATWLVTGQMQNTHTHTHTQKATLKGGILPFFFFGALGGCPSSWVVKVRSAQIPAAFSSSPRRHLNRVWPPAPAGAPSRPVAHQPQRPPLLVWAELRVVLFL